MQIHQIHRRDTGLFSQQQLELCYDQNAFIPFIREAFSMDGFVNGMNIRNEQFTALQRQHLHDALSRQYEGVTDASESIKNIDRLLQPNTYTITTGHQLSVFSGPAYFIYKIAHVIRQTELLNQQFPSAHFVPVYWMASEDHDYEEIKSFFLFHKQHQWETQQSGPVGRFSMENWTALRSLLHELFSNHPEAEIHALIDSLSGTNYAAAFRNFVHTLFGRYGLVIVDGDDPILKKDFQPIVEQELRSRFSFNAVSKTNEELLRMGAKIQVTPREINLFYIEDGLRERIVPDGDNFTIANKGTFSLEALIQLSNEQPECFSPNVVLRPLYQELILPNLNYVGGGGEINYWLQLKGVFDAANVPYPLIQVRNSIMWVDGATSEKMEKLGYHIEQLFLDTDLLKKRFVEANSSEELDFRELDGLIKALSALLKKQALQVDPQLEQYSIAEAVRLEKQIDGFKDKLYRTSKSQHDKALKSIDQIKDRLFPNGNLQERVMNFFQLTPTGNYAETIEFVKNTMQPFGSDLIVVVE